jgi:hypothetical protein
MFLLIFNEQRVLKFTFVLVLTYYVNHSYIIKTAVKTAEVEEQKREKKTWKSYQSVIYSKHRKKY